MMLFFILGLVLGFVVAYFSLASDRLTLAPGRVLYSWDCDCCGGVNTACSCYLHAEGGPLL